MSKVLFTGGTSLLALNWAYLIRSKHQVYLGIHARNACLFGVHYVPLTLNNINKLIKEVDNIRPNLIINTTGLTSVEACESDPMLAKQVNVEFASNIACVARELNISLVHISTDHLFSGLNKNESEISEPCPVNEYGKSKLAAERLVLELNSSALVLRTNFYGWGSSFKQSFSDWIISQLRAKNEINVFSDVFYTPILISNLVEIAHQLLDRSASGIYNVIGSERLSKYDFAVSLARVFNLPQDLLIPTSIAEARHLVKRPKDMSLSNLKLKNELGCDLPDTISSLRELLRQEQNGLSNEIFNSICR
jgi:dTDP-4-dehydrorhamnose reductase